VYSFEIGATAPFKIDTYSFEIGAAAPFEIDVVFL